MEVSNGRTKTNNAKGKIEEIIFKNLLRKENNYDSMFLLEEKGLI